MSSQIYQAIQQICEEKNLQMEQVVSTIEAALAAAYRKDFGEKNENIKVEFEPKTGQFRVFDIKTIVEGPAEDKEEINPRSEILLSEYIKDHPDAKIGDEIKTELFPTAEFGRMAAQTAKQVVIQRLREAEREMIFNEYKGKEGEIIVGTVQRVEGRLVLVNLGSVTAIVPPSEQIPRERYDSGQRIKAVVNSVSIGPRGPEVVLSRASPEMVRKFFAIEVPEIANGAVELRAVAREAGERSKIAVKAMEENIDPIGACVGQRGSRVQTVISELGGEKIDIIEYSDDPIEFITNALAPAKVLSIKLNEEAKEASVEVDSAQFSLAIGRGGQNVRLASKLTGWKISLIEKKPEGTEEKPEEIIEGENIEDEKTEIAEGEEVRIEEAVEEKQTENKAEVKESEEKKEEE